ncbi:MAG: S8 family serine peptidase [Kiritimatiellae bacterium]|nr:S8 family serine peptidase [Kiritimatiellia bacterium]
MTRKTRLTILAVLLLPACALVLMRWRAIRPSPAPAARKQADTPAPPRAPGKDAAPPHTADARDLPGPQNPRATPANAAAAARLSLAEARRRFSADPEVVGDPVAPQFEIHLQAARIDTARAGRYGQPAANAARLFRESKQQRSARDVLPFVLQFDGAVRAEAKAAVRKAGGILRGYLPYNAFVAELTEDALARTAQLPGVQWIGEFRPSFKIQPFLAYLTDEAARGEAAAVAVPGRLAVTVQTFAPEEAESVAACIRDAGGAVELQTAGTRCGRVRARVAPARVGELAALAAVHWIEEYVEPELCNDLAVSSSHMNVSFAWAMGFAGTNQVIGHADTGLDTGSAGTIHPDFAGRIKAAFARARAAWSDPDGHGTHTAGSILGSGAASGGQYKGVAYEAQIVHQSVMDSAGRLTGIGDEYDLFHQTYTNGARLHSDSWGAAVGGAYDYSARRTDEYMWDHPDMLVLFSAGNEGTDANRNGVVDPDSIGSPGTAKNCLTVGAAESDRAPGSGGLSSYTWGQAWGYDFPANPVYGDYIDQSAQGPQGIAGFSSRGPTDDGRVKPDIVAPGTDIISCRSQVASGTGWGVKDANYLFMGGTSMACPLTAGAAALARQFLVELEGIANPSAAAVKALLVNGAVSLSPGQYGTGAQREIPAAPRPNNVEGWGQVNVDDTLFPPAPLVLTVHDGDSLATGQHEEYEIGINGTNTLRVTLAYTDYPGTAGSGKALVNDLDLVLIAPNGTNYFPGGGSAPNRTDNVEGIDLPNPPSGTYTIRVSGYNTPQGPQPFALVVCGPVSSNAPGVLKFGSSTLSAGEGDGSASITVARAGGSDGTVTVDYATSNGTAQAGTDYTAAAGTLTFGNGETAKAFAVPLADDAEIESAETVLLSLGAVTGGAQLGTPSHAVLTLADNDASSSTNTLLSEAFSAGLPAGWSVLDNQGQGGVWRFDDPGGRGNLTGGSGGFAIADSDYYSEIWMYTELRTPSLNCTELASVFVSFRTDFLYYWPDTAATVWTRGTDGEWTNVWAVQAEDVPGPTNIVVDISHCAGDTNVVISFYYQQAGNDWWWQVDDVAVYGAAGAGTLQFSAASYGVDEDGGPVVVTVVRTNGETGTVTVDYATSDGTAESGSDYTAAAGTLTLADGVLSGAFSVSVQNDSAVEPAETVALALGNPTGGAMLGAPSTATLTITDDDALTNVYLESDFGDGLPGGWTVVDNEGWGATWRFDNPGARSNYTGGAGTFAIADSDYYGFWPMDTELRTPVMNLGGAGVVGLEFKSDFTWYDEELADVDVSTGGAAGPWSNVWRRAGDHDFGPQTCMVDLTDLAAGASNVMVRFHYYGAYWDWWWQIDEVRILGDTPANPGTLQFESAEFTVAETGTNAVVTVLRTGGQTASVTVQYGTSDGSAEAGVDYTAAAGTLTFEAGQASRTFLVPIQDDSADETNETVNLTLSNPTGGAALAEPSVATLTIVDDEAGTGLVVAVSFEAGLPDGWTVATNAHPDGYWRFDNPAARSNYTGGAGSFAIADSDDAGKFDMDTELRTPEMDLTDFETVRLQFRTDFNWYYWGGYEAAAVDVSANGDAGPWSNVWEKKSDDYPGPVVETVDISACAAGQSNVMVRFHYKNAYWDWWWEVDDIEIGGGLKSADRDGDGMPDWWETDNFSGATNGLPGEDPDQDGFSNLDEYVAGTDPNQSNSTFRVEDLQNQDGRAISFQTEAGRLYDVMYSTNLAVTNWLALETGIPGTGRAKTIVDTNDAPWRFYRLQVTLP